eukprot:CAMPEP_0185725284 /NCGR_PEP_ID=MMETSP1171-20130828/1577_1 /TAXON_ID=374046 /ORGANISM="Helicotheca tamensis, Strain CCMP826" /LENGTH=207 /DNA_ID=CAMNT_0028393367 /DNA_START=65 /DNA_END=688 /DNA_ORIENTATION=-
MLLAAFVAPLAEAFLPVGTMRPSLSTTSSTCRYDIATPPPPPGYAEEEKDKRKSKIKVKHGRDAVLRVETVQEYKDLVVDEKERITVVRFYARWCKMCRASEPFFYKLAADFSVHNVNFVEVPLNKHTAILHQALEVPSLPWTHIYHPEAGLVEERTVNKKHIDEVRKCLRCYVYGECDLADEPASCANVYGECDIEDGPISKEVSP